MLSSMARLFAALNDKGRTSDIEEGLQLLDSGSRIIPDDEQKKIIGLLDSEEELIERIVIVKSKPAPPSFLYQEIDDCLSILRELYSNIPDVVSRRNKLQLYKTLFMLLNVGTVIASPILLVKLLTMYVDKFFAEEIKSAEGMLKNLAQHRQELNKDIDNINAMPLMRDAPEQLLVLYKEWFKADVNNSNCDDWLHKGLGIYLPKSYVINEICVLEEQNVTHPDRFCNDIANRMCEIDKPYKIKINERDGYAEDLENVMDSIIQTNDRISLLNNWDNNALPKEENNLLIASIIGCTIISLAAIPVLGYYGVSYYHLHNEHKEDVLKAHQVSYCINDPSHANRIINLTSRLGIKLENLTIEKLIQRLEAERDEINYRWKCRTAFLGGALKREAGNHDFLHMDGSRDVTKIIFDMADLGPLKMNVNS